MGAWQRRKGFALFRLATHVNAAPCWPTAAPVTRGLPANTCSQFSGGPCHKDLREEQNEGNRQGSQAGRTKQANLLHGKFGSYPSFSSA